jgi:hypothetical protein
VNTARREQAKALFTELKSLLREIQETETAGLVQDAPDGTGLPALLGSLHSLRGFCSARALLYARIADLLCFHPISTFVAQQPHASQRG